MLHSLRRTAFDITKCNVIEMTICFHRADDVIKPDFHSRFSLVASENFRMGHAQSGETNKTERKNIFRSVRIEVQIFQLLRNFLTAKPIRLFLESRGHFTRIKKFLQNGLPTALSGLREGGPQYILKTRIIELQISFRLRQFFAGTLRKWRLIFLLRYFSLTKNSVSDRRKV